MVISPPTITPMRPIQTEFMKPNGRGSTRLHTRIPATAQVATSLFLGFLLSLTGSSLADGGALLCREFPGFPCDGVSRRGPWPFPWGGIAVRDAGALATTRRSVCGMLWSVCLSRLAGGG